MGRVLRTVVIAGGIVAAGSFFALCMLGESDDVLRYGPKLRAQDLEVLPPTTLLARVQLDLERRFVNKGSLPPAAWPLIHMTRLENMVNVGVLGSQDDKVRGQLRELALACSAIGLKEHAGLLSQALASVPQDPQKLYRQWMALLESSCVNEAKIAYIKAHRKELWP